MNKNSKIRFIILSFLFFFLSPSEAKLRAATTEIIPIKDLQGYENYPVTVKQLIVEAKALTAKNLTYLFGSADPKAGGMDCSGTIHYLLSYHTNAFGGIPRSSSEMYEWVRKKGKFYFVCAQDFNSTQFSHLKPGDLLFWKGTYHSHGNASASHVMLYLGKNKENQPLMFGSSDGRTYQGKSLWGVSVFDFRLPNASSSARFLGYSCIPDLTC